MIPLLSNLTVPDPFTLALVDENSSWWIGLSAVRNLFRYTWTDQNLKFPQLIWSDLKWNWTHQFRHSFKKSVKGLSLILPLVNSFGFETGSNNRRRTHLNLKVLPHSQWLHSHHSLTKPDCFYPGQVSTPICGFKLEETGIKSHQLFQAITKLVWKIQCITKFLMPEHDVADWEHNFCRGFDYLE